MGSPSGGGTADFVSGVGAFSAGWKPLRAAEASEPQSAWRALDNLARRAVACSGNAEASRGLELIAGGGISRLLFLFALPKTVNSAEPVKIVVPPRSSGTMRNLSGFPVNQELSHFRARISIRRPEIYLQLNGGIGDRMDQNCPILRNYGAVLTLRGSIEGALFVEVKVEPHRLLTHSRVTELREQLGFCFRPGTVS